MAALQVDLEPIVSPVRGNNRDPWFKFQEGNGSHSSLWSAYLSSPSSLFRYLVCRLHHPLNVLIDLWPTLNFLGLFFFSLFALSVGVCLSFLSFQFSLFRFCPPPFFFSCFWIGYERRETRIFQANNGFEEDDEEFMSPTICNRSIQSSSECPVVRSRSTFLADTHGRISLSRRAKKKKNGRKTHTHTHIHKRK